MKSKKYNIKELMKNTDFEAQRNDETLKNFQEKEFVGREYFNFSIEKMEEAMKGKPQQMPRFDSIEQLDEWLERGCENE